MKNFFAKVKAFFVKKDGGDRSLLTKQAIAIIACLVVIAIILPVYFIWIKPSENVKVRPDVIYDGEYFEEATSVLYLFPPRTRNDIEAVRVKTSAEEYTIRSYVSEGYSKYAYGTSNLYFSNDDLSFIAAGKGTGKTATLVGDKIKKTALQTYGIDLSAEKSIRAEIEGRKYTFALGSSKSLDAAVRYYITVPENANSEEYAVYSVNALSSSTQFRLVGNDKYTLDQSAVAAVVVQTTVVSATPVAKGISTGFRVTDSASESDLAKYGLDPASSPAEITVELSEGGEYTFYVGKELPSKAGYYATVKDRRNGDKYIVYIIGTSSSYYLKGCAALISTLVTTPVGDGADTLGRFELHRKGAGGNRAMIVNIGPADDASNISGTNTFRLIYPKGYTLDETSYTKSVTYNLAYIYAKKVVDFGERIHSEAVYSGYGLDLDPERLKNGTDNCYAKIVFAADENAEDKDASVLYFSEKMTGEDGASFYYVYSPEFDAVYMLSADTFEFVEWSLAKFSQGTLYYNYINCTDYFEIISKRAGISVRYTMTGNENTYKTVATEAGEGGKLLTKIDENGKTVDAIFNLKYKTTTVGLYTIKDKYGDFENFRSLFYVLITRRLALEGSTEGLDVSAEPFAQINIADTPNDQPITYSRYDEKGRRVYYTDENGNRRPAQVRYLGGNIVCTNVKTTLDSGTVLDYATAYYDEEKGRFFLKEVSTIDGNLKPKYTYNEENELVVSQYLPKSTTGEYTQTFYTYKFYDIYNTVTDANGNEVKQINETFKLSVPSSRSVTYRIETDGSRTVVSETAEEASTGVLIRTQILEKLFSDSQKLLSGIEINRDAVN